MVNPTVVIQLVDHPNVRFAVLSSEQIEHLLSFVVMTIDRAGVTFGDWIESNEATNPSLEAQLQNTFEVLQQLYKGVA